MELAILFQMTFIGMPCVFYGDEKGMKGMTEKEYRMPMPWNDHSHLSEVYRKLITLRKDNKALTRGVFKTVETTGMLFRYAREWNDERIQIAVNPGDSSAAYSAPGDVLLKKNCTCDLLMPKGYVITRSVNHGKYDL